jgi:hypothetical protein
MDFRAGCIAASLEADGRLGQGLLAPGVSLATFDDRPPTAMRCQSFCSKLFQRKPALGTRGQVGFRCFVVLRCAAH